MELMVTLSAGKTTGQTYPPLRQLSAKEIGARRPAPQAPSTPAVDITELFDNA
jgi:hypothetical protein